MAFFAVIAGTIVAVFTLYFALSWIGEPSFSPTDYALEFRDLTAPFVERYIVEGRSDAEIVALLDGNARVLSLVEESRAEGFAEGVDLNERSFGRITRDYLVELLDPNLLIPLPIGTLFGILASIWLSRKLVRPLTNLAAASRALGKNDFSQRVALQGTDEINVLAASFNEMAAQLEHTETVRQHMLADISHELRTPLAGLEGTLRATLDGVFELDKQHISNLYGQTRHLSRLVDDLHLLARAEARRLTLDKTPTDLATLLHELLDVFRLLADDAEITLREEITPTAPVAVDAGRIRQVVSNLLNNALRHTPAGGTITLALKQNDGSAEIRVTDTGEGISAEHLPHLFDRFYRADGSRSRDTGGTGLGLAITKALVEAHGGVISAESNGLVVCQH